MQKSVWGTGNEPGFATAYRLMHAPRTRLNQFYGNPEDIGERWEEAQSIAD